MKKLQSRLPLFALVGGISTLAACGGGGSGTATAPVAANATIGRGTLAPASGGGLRMTITIHRGNSTRPSQQSSARHVAGTRRTQYVSYYAQGLQLTVTSGSASQVLYYSLSPTSSPNCTSPTSDVYACTLTVPTLGATETLSGIEVDEQPNNVNSSTGLGTAIPSNSYILAVGSTTVTLTPGAWTNVALGLNPVIVSLQDCAADLGGDNFGTEYPDRIVVTANTPVTTQLGTAAADVDNFPPLPLSLNPTTGQPFVDVNGSPQPLIATSSSTHFQFFPVPNVSPAPAPTYGVSASIPNSTYEYQSIFGVNFDVSYDGQATSPMTLTISNGLTATAPVFTGAPVTGPPAPPSTYANSFTWNVIPFSAAPATLTFASPSAAMQTITATAVGEPNDYSAPSTCVSSGNVTIANIASAGDISGGIQSFNVTPVAAGTCSFTITDGNPVPSVVSNTVTVTVQEPPG